VDAQLDSFDRKLLGLLQDDATLKYADLAERVHLSAPAVHERVRKLRRRRIIRRTTVELDAAALGLGLTAFVHVYTQGWTTDQMTAALASHPNIDEMHTVAGSACFIVKVRAASPEHLQTVLRDIFQAGTVFRTESFLVLKTLVARGPSPSQEALPAPAV
jgi:Lrp/AsnC family transcriptional regulator, leucine-responsive regulatory protein